MKYKALLTLPEAWNDYLDGAKSILAENDIEPILVRSDNGLEEDDLINHLKDCDAYMMSVDIVNERVLSECPKLKVLAKHGIGLDNIDIPAATRHHVPVCNTPGSNSGAVADMTFSLLLALCRKLVIADSAVRRNDFTQIMGTELSGKTIGIIGFGAIGKAVALRANGFGMKVLAYDKYMDMDFCGKHSVKPASLDEMIPVCDFFTIHLPLNPGTRNLLDSEAISKMKKGALIVNVARGGILDEEACAKALATGQLGGVGLDVYMHEPPDLSESIFNAPNVVFSSHMAGCTKESIARSAEMAAQNIVTILNGGTVPSVVNKEIYSK